MVNHCEIAKQKENISIQNTHYSPPRVVPKGTVEQAPRRVALALLHGLILAFRAATQPPHHDEGPDGKPNHEEQQHGHAQAVGVGSMPPLKTYFIQIDVEAQSRRIAAEAAACKEAKGHGAEAGPNEVE